MKELDEAFDLLHREARGAPADLADARQRLLDEIDGIKPRPARRRWMIPVAAAAAVAVAATVVTVRIDWSDKPELPLAADVLNKAADIAAVGAVDIPVGPGQYRYIVSQGSSVITVPGRSGTTGRADYPYLRQQRIERWIPADPNGLLQERRTAIGKPVYIGTEPEPATGPTQVKKLTTTEDGIRQRTCTSVEELSGYFGCDAPNTSAFYTDTLTGDPDLLYDKLTTLTMKNGAKPTPSTMFGTGVDILSRGLMPAQLRAKWYRVLAKIPGVSVIDRRTIPDGRTGIALGLDDERGRRELIIDPATGEFIGEHTVAGPKPENPLIKPGTVMNTSAITTSVVNGLGLTS
nr:CU044_5270 family protein [Kibdelosporangium sp. MJ126-NF4]CEL20060.1 putative RNA polymerase sigma (70) factor [Kibdelosporangium sp. MJ126-NF4]CTQ97284.1 putative RNA polymerase sigma (70) factor [Kibdelosporangium sp. MJ126-NF4]